ncbi:MAG: cyclic-di-AMP receptor [Anaerolineales bacterium]
MKMLIVILRDEDAETVLEALIEESFGVTRIATTGGFFRRGNTTLIIGTEDERVDEVFGVIDQHAGEPEDPTHRRATAFVLNVADFKKL